MLRLQFITCSDHLKIRHLNGFAALMNCHIQRFESINHLLENLSSDSLVILDEMTDLEDKDFNNLQKADKIFIICPKNDYAQKKFAEIFRKFSNIKVIAFIQKHSFITDPTVLFMLKTLIQTPQSLPIENMLGFGHMKCSHQTINDAVLTLNKIHIKPNLCKQISSYLRVLKDHNNLSDMLTFSDGVLYIHKLLVNGTEQERQNLLKNLSHINYDKCQTTCIINESSPTNSDLIWVTPLIPDKFKNTFILSRFRK